MSAKEAQPCVVDRRRRRERLESRLGERGAGVCWRNCPGQCGGDPRSPSRRASRHQRSAVGACGFAGPESRVWPKPRRGLCRPRHRLRHWHARRAGHWPTRILVADDLRGNKYEPRRVDRTGSGGSASFRAHGLKGIPHARHPLARPRRPACRFVHGDPHHHGQIFLAHRFNVTAASATGAVMGRTIDASRAIGAFCSIDGCDAD